MPGSAEAHGRVTRPDVLPQTLPEMALQSLVNPLRYCNIYIRPQCPTRSVICVCNDAILAGSISSARRSLKLSLRGLTAGCALISVTGRSRFAPGTLGVAFYGRPVRAVPAYRWAFTLMLRGRRWRLQLEDDWALGS